MQEEFKFLAMSGLDDDGDDNKDDNEDDDGDEDF